MATTLSVAELRGLAKLHRAGVDGAGQHLAEMVVRHGDELPELLGFPQLNLRRLREHADPVEVLVTTIEAAPRVVREAHRRAQRQSATRTATAVAQSATWVGDNIELDAALVGAAVAAWGGAGDIVFGDRGGIDIRRLRSLLKECRRLPISMSLTATTLNINWATPRSHGYFKLWLRPAATDADNLVMPLPAVPTSHAAIVAEVRPRRAHPRNLSPEAAFVTPAAKAGPPSIEDASCRPHDAAEGVEIAPRPPLTPACIVEAPRRPTAHRPSRGFAVRFIEAIAAAMGPS